MSKPKIIIGTIEIAGAAAIYARTFRELGYEVRTILMFKNWAFPDEEYDSVCIKAPIFNYQAHFQGLNLISKSAAMARLGAFGVFEFIKSLGKNNWFIFLYGSNFIPFHYTTSFLNYLDYAILKRMNNSIISIFCGCDIRDKTTFSYFAKKNQLGDCCGICEGKITKCDPRRARRVVRGAEKYSDIILSQPDYSFLLTRPYYYYWLPLETGQYTFLVPRNKIPRIVHFPTDRYLKGTDLIVQALNQLRQDGFQFETLILEKISNQKVREELTKGDILIDQLYSDTTGMLSLEGMASGCAVLCGLNKEFQHLPAECPAIPTNPTNIYNNLKCLLENREEIYRTAEQGIKYINKFHDSINVVKSIIHLIEEQPSNNLI